MQCMKWKEIFTILQRKKKELKTASDTVCLCSNMLLFGKILWLLYLEQMYTQEKAENQKKKKKEKKKKMKST